MTEDEPDIPAPPEPRRERPRRPLRPLGKSAQGEFTTIAEWQQEVAALEDKVSRLNAAYADRVKDSDSLIIANERLTRELNQTSSLATRQGKLLASIYNAWRNAPDTAAGWWEFYEFIRKAL